MAIVLHEILSGGVDGVNDKFAYSAPYKPGTAAIYRNGQLWLHSGGNVWTESNPGIGEITFNAGFIPQAGDEIAGFALDANATNDIVFVDELVGTMNDVDSMSGSFNDVNAISGTMSDVDTMSGSLFDSDQMSGSMNDIDTMAGTLEDC